MRFFRDLLLTVLVLAGFVFLLEAGLRLAGVKYESSFYTNEHERGYALRPGAEGWTVDEGENYVKINHDGMRDVERPYTHRRDVIRIAVVGSSEVEAEQVPLDRTFEAVMQRRLNTALSGTGRRVEVLNFGVPGYSLAQEYLTLRDQVWKYDPQIVILTTTAYVLLRNTREFHEGAIEQIPFYALKDGKLVPDEATLHLKAPDPARLVWMNRAANLLNSSRILLMLNEARTESKGVTRALLAHFRPAPPPRLSKLAPGTGDQLFDPDNPKFREDWSITDAFFKLMKQDTDRRGTEFWVVISERSESVNPDSSKRLALAHSLGLKTLFEADQRLGAMASRDGALETVLAPPLALYAEHHGVALHGFFNTGYNTGHWNVAGHEQAGLLITAALLKQSRVLHQVETLSARGRGTVRLAQLK